MKEVFRKLVLKLIRKYRDMKSRGSPYKLPLQELIDRSVARCVIQKPVCPHCGNPMEFRHSKIVVEVFPVRNDIGYKCTNCYHTCHFGIPMTQEDALKEIDLRGSPYLTRPTYRSDERDMEIVKERLRKLGYIE